jgi:hypothetical protein
MLLILSFFISIFGYGSYALSSFYALVYGDEQLNLYSWLRYFVISNEDLWFAIRFGHAIGPNLLHLAIHLTIVLACILVTTLLPFFVFRKLWRWAAAGK